MIAEKGALAGRFGADTEILDQPYRHTKVDTGGSGSEVSVGLIHQLSKHNVVSWLSPI